MPHRTSRLVTTGVYRLSRNPMYLGLLFLLMAWSFWLANISAVAFIPLFIFYINHFQIVPEERVLTEIFQDDYKSYCSRVRRWL